MTDLATIRSSLEQCYAAVDSLAAGLTSDQWRAQSLCPDWDMRGVVAHLGMMERVMTGWLPASVEDTPPLDRIEPYFTEAAVLDDSAFARRIADVFAARRTDLAGLQEQDLDRPSWTPIGPRTYGGFLEIRIFDFWVHERDITTPLGWPSDDAGARAEIALGQVESSIGYIVGKRVGLPDGSSIVFHLTGPVKRDISVVVNGRAKAVDHITDPTVQLTTDTVTFIQLAAGRIDPQAQIDAGKVSWTGDDELGDRAARNLRFTI
ncbi:MAG TPA: maleylpyruvate isomerase N-terminal domain-containing protein [Streptosporangiaceae bacterium]|nr:maleylpyruvate isomerase N-terminal domain-containing protein [Streptosporangiaceae bacterium]